MKEGFFMEKTQKRRVPTRVLASGGILTAVSIVLMFLELSLPFIPSFLELDLSNIPALIGGFAFGPVAGVLIVLVKDLIHMMISHTAFVGELADFLMSGSFTLTASLIYMRKKSRARAFAGMGAATAVMTIAGAFTNYFILLPFYARAFMPMDQILEMCAGVNSLITDKLSYVLYGVVPFNIIKGLVISVITALTYKHISRIIRK